MSSRGAMFFFFFKKLVDASIVSSHLLQASSFTVQSSVPGICCFLPTGTISSNHLYTLRAFESFLTLVTLNLCLYAPMG